MASSKEYLEYVCDLLRDVEGISTKKMMGEYLLYQSGVLFGGVYSDRFLIKNTPSLRSRGMREEIPYEGAKPMLLVDTEDSEQIAALVMDAVRDLCNK